MNLGSLAPVFITAIPAASWELLHIIPVTAVKYTIVNVLVVNFIAHSLIALLCFMQFYIFNIFILYYYCYIIVMLHSLIISSILISPYLTPSWFVSLFLYHRLTGFINWLWTSEKNVSETRDYEKPSFVYLRSIKKLFCLRDILFYFFVLRIMSVLIFILSVTEVSWFSAWGLLHGCIRALSFGDSECCFPLNCGI